MLAKPRRLQKQKNFYAEAGFRNENSTEGNA